MKYELFSKRQKRLRGEVPDVYQYETIPRELRVQIFYIWQKVWGEVYYNYDEELQGSKLAMGAYSSIDATLREEYGMLTLGKWDSVYEIVRDFLLETEDTEKVIDVIEVSFRYIDQVVRDTFNASMDFEKSPPNKIPILAVPNNLVSTRCGISPDEAIDQLNCRFREHGIGYQYESGQIIKVDSQFVHSEVVKPALSMLSDPIYKGANEEFLKAHEHYRKRNYKDCVNNCLKAFESCLKIICQKNSWNYSEKDTANRLIEIVFKHNLIDPRMTCHFTALGSTLKSGVPTVRNNQSGHGQGPKEVVVPEYIASYILHLTASNILLLAKADEDMK